MRNDMRRMLKAPWLAVALTAERMLSWLQGAFKGPYVKAVLVECEQGRFLARPGDRTVGGLMARTGTYGADEIRRILSLTTPDSRVLVVGSHIGALVVPLAARVAHVTAVEANPDTFELLDFNLKLNACGNVRAVHLAAGDRDGEIDFVQNTSNSGGSKRLPIVRRHMYFHDRPRITRVPCARLDDVLADDYDLVLMDIEGSEYFALLGMPRLVSRARHLVSEFLPRHLRDVAGVTGRDFAQLVEPHFDTLFIPSRNETVGRQHFARVLTEMFESDAGDDGIVFSKA
jgi:FkbM family methyltransferase